MEIGRRKNKSFAQYTGVGPLSASTGRGWNQKIQADSGPN
jgi:hypothetical protein